ncbi:MAG: rhodanese-like domain-containing protein [Nitrospinota bacterium]|nr:rhodanese-like domain-containing protein [Nitrospinota bacterium]
MDIRDYFRPVPAVSVEKLREEMKGPRRDQIIILDVRQPEENQRERIPGSTLIPLGEIPHRIKELDKSRPIFVYCRSGNRSAAAGGMLLGAGFKEVYNVDGGMFSWDGLLATGAIGSGMVFLTPGSPFDEVVAAAWAMEEGSAAFYRFALDNLKLGPAKPIFEFLANSEKGHMDAILKIYIGLAGKDIEGATSKYRGEGCCMEGGVKLSEAKKWAVTADVDGILEFSMGMEANSYDLYTKLSREARDPDTGKFFKSLAEEEWSHLLKMSQMVGANI